METTRFDHLTRHLAATSTRRRAMTTLAAVGLGLGVGLTGRLDGDAKRRKKRCKKLGQPCNPGGKRKCCKGSCLPPLVGGGPSTCTEVCQPDCAGKSCGDDGCGGSCGTCTLPLICKANGTCGVIILP